MVRTTAVLVAGIAAAAVLICARARGAGEARTIAADSPEIRYSGYVRKEIIPPDGGNGVARVRFDRVLDMPGKGYRWDNPGACIRFRTDATRIGARFAYTGLHVSTSARNGVGACSVDGTLRPEWTFRTRQAGILRKPEILDVSLAAGAGPGFHDYRLFMPYGDSVDFEGLSVNPEARFEAPKPAPRVRYVAYGDSITHGFAASGITGTYPFLVAEDKGWEAVNLGLGGRQSTPSDAGVIVALKPGIVTILMGTNDWQGGVRPDRYRANMDAFLSGIRSSLPAVPIYLLTPLWVDASWRTHGIAPLEAYRSVLRDLAAARKDPNLHVVEGAGLIDPDKALFDAIAVHPDDAGFAMMARRLAAQLPSPAPDAGAR